MSLESKDSLRRLTALDLSDLNHRLDKLGAGEIVRWATEGFSGRLCMLSAFQQAGCVLCHMVADMGLASKVDVIFVDTGVNFPETLETVERMRREYGLNVVTLHPELTMAQQVAKEGVLYLNPDGQKRCCHLRKHLPLLQIRGRYDGMLSSLRRESGGRRSEIDALALDTELNLLRIHPLLNMSREAMDDYIVRHGVIINPLHDQGYPTVSCTRCTTPVLPGEDERAGRWRHLEHAAKYCNINPTDRARYGDNSEFVELQFQTVERIMDFQI